MYTHLSKLILSTNFSFSFCVRDICIWPSAIPCTGAAGELLSFLAFLRWQLPKVLWALGPKVLFGKIWLLWLQLPARAGPMCKNSPHSDGEPFDSPSTLLADLPRKQNADLLTYIWCVNQFHCIKYPRRLIQCVWLTWPRTPDVGMENYTEFLNSTRSKLYDDLYNPNPSFDLIFEWQFRCKVPNMTLNNNELSTISVSMETGRVRPF